MNKSLDKLSFLNNVICICFYGRSGSVFLQSLFDNHPDVITFPGTYLMGFQEWWDSLQTHKSSEVIKSFIKTYEVMFNPFLEEGEDVPGCGRRPGIDLNFHKTGVNKDKVIAVNRNIFIKELLKLSENNFKEDPLKFFKKIHLALALTQNIKLSNKTRIVFQLHTPNEKRIKFLHSNEVSTKVLYAIREPHITAISLYKHYLKRGSSDMNLKTILRIMNNFSPIKGFENKSACIRLEDLHLDSENTIKAFAKYSELDVHENLKESTFQGTNWNNVSGTNDVRGFNKVIPAKRHFDCVTLEDEKRYEFIFQNLYLFWGYRKKPIRGVSFFSLLKKFKIEKNNDFRGYLISRIYICKLIIQNNSFIRKILSKRKRIIIPLVK